LKSLNVVYRPAVPEGIRAGHRPPLSGRPIGASPSGKAVDFDSTMRRFESSRPSQPVRLLENIIILRQKGPQMAGFSCVRSFCGDRFSHQSLRISLKVSTYPLENSRFLQTRFGDRGRKPLRGDVALKIPSIRANFTG
jgi:hypothetical protein